MGVRHMARVSHSGCILKSPCHSLLSLLAKTKRKAQAQVHPQPGGGAVQPGVGFGLRSI